ncbi:MAG TPA: tubulin-like doman-containing protein [Blastocatellia bacterium]|nr:tubulin-like doman-containing protein [Blastocatellia bacterium]
MADDQTKLSDEKIAKARNVAPTLLVGLGGTGKEVLLRLRRRLYERYGIFGFPTMGYLWIDTDTRNRNIDDQPLDHIMQQVMLREEERVSAEIPGDAFMGYFRDQRAFPHIFSWLDPRLASLGQVLNGAGQVRPLGRLAFFHCNTDIRRKLDKIRARITQQSAVEQMLNEYDIVVDPTLLDIVIVCSLAGGTGSGMFLDAAFMCRQALSNPDITGYLLLPSVFADAIKGSEKIYANAYAALKELEYYSLRKDLLEHKRADGNGSPTLAQGSRHDFVADWENRQRDFGSAPPPIPPPPFNTCYLIDNVTQAGGAIGPRDKSFLCDMIAENIFLNFSSDEFARMRDSNRANLEQYLGNPLIYKYGEDGYTEVFSQRFSAFGFSKLYVPVDRIRRACGYQLALDLIARWLKHNELGEIEVERRLLERELVKLSLRAGPGAGPGGDDFIRELSWVRIGERTFDDEIRDWVNQQRAGLLQEAATGKPPQLFMTLQRLLADFAKRNFDKTDSRKENWGTYIKTLELNRERLIRLLCGEFSPGGERLSDGTILTQVKDWLNDEHVRLDLAVEYLKVLGKILNRHVDDLYAKAKDGNERRARSSYDDLKIKQEMVREEEGGWLVQRKSLRALVEHICDRMQEHLRARMNVFILTAAIEVIQTNLKPYIGKEEIKKDAQGNDVPDRAGLVLELWLLKEQMSELYAELEDRFKSFDEVQEHLIYENLYEKELFRKHYQIIDQIGAVYPVSAKIDEMEGLLFQQLGIVNPYDLRARIEDRGPERVRQQIEDFCYTRFHKLEVNADALESFRRKYQNKEERERRLERFVTNGSVRLRKSHQAGILRQVMHNLKEQAIITDNPKNREKYPDVYDSIESLVKAAGYQETSRPVAARADAVFLYTEYAGLPLAYIGNIDRYRDEAYLPLIRQEAFLHTDRREEKFTDILIKNLDEVAQTLRANRALLVGAILRALTVSSDDIGPATFAFVTSRAGVPDRQPLGKEHVAIETLKRNGTLLGAIETEIIKRRNSLSPVARQKFFAVLAYHTMRENDAGLPPGPFAPISIETSQGTIETYSPEWRALDEIRTQEYQALVQSLGSDKSVEDRFMNHYQRLDDFTQKIRVNGRWLRLLKDGFDN